MLEDILFKWKIRVTASQIIPVFIKNVLLVAYGMTMGYPTILIPNLSNPTSEDSIRLNEEEISWIGSINMLSCVLACSVSGVVSQIIGRKITMQVTSVFIILCWIAIIFCNDVWQLYVALFVFGLSGGLLESPVLTYVAEITQPHLRGSLLSTGTLSIALGTFFEFLLGSIFEWRIVAKYSIIPPSLAFILLFFVPESPYWLITKNRLQTARESLAIVRGWSAVEKIEPEFQEMLANSDNKQSTSFKTSDYLQKQFLRPFILLLYLFFIFHFTGYSALMIYSVNIFDTLKVPMNIYDANVILGAAQLTGCLICIFVIHYIGRRLLAFLSLITTMISLISLGTYAYLTNTKFMYFAKETADNADLEYSWIPLVFIVVAVFALNLGVRSLPWILLAEVFSMKTRAVATGALGAISYGIGFACRKTFLSITAAITLPGVFWVYGFIAFISLIIVYFYLPETEGKSFQEIANHFAGTIKLETNKRKDGRNKNFAQEINRPL